MLFFKCAKLAKTSVNHRHLVGGSPESRRNNK